MKYLNENDIVDEVLVCPYCMNEVSHEALGCCGESSAHFETGYITKDDDLLLASEFELVDEPFEDVVTFEKVSRYNKGEF